MNASEVQAREYLLACGFSDVRFEPDGNVPPDLLADNRIAVEVRRLNQQESSSGRSRGTEETAIPIARRLRRLLLELGPADKHGSLIARFGLLRPTSGWPAIEKGVREYLRRFTEVAPEASAPFEVAPGFSVTVLPSANSYLSRFVYGGLVDGDTAGAIFGELRRNIDHCVAEKSSKIESVRKKYAEWWLVLEDHIALALPSFDVLALRNAIAEPTSWDRVILLSPNDHNQAITLWGPRAPR